MNLRDNERLPGWQLSGGGKYGSTRYGIRQQDSRKRHKNAASLFRESIAQRGTGMGKEPKILVQMHRLEACHIITYVILQRQLGTRDLPG